MIKKFYTAGNAIFTLKIPADFANKFQTPNHYTFRIRKCKKDRFWVDLLRGPENTRDYSYLGELNPETGAIRKTAGSSYPETSWPFRLIRRVMVNIINDTPERLGQFKVYHAGKCGRCGRRLTVPSSIESGLGPICEGL